MQKAEKFKQDLAILEACIVSFGNLAENVSKLISQGILFFDMRTEMKRIEETIQN